jgi:hypothetical protein
MKKAAAALMALIPCFVIASGQSPYAGEEIRSIKSLSEQEIESLRRGDGMGFAKLAELNHFPGPKHVLDIADELGLSPQQLARTQSLYEEMRHNAVTLGEELLVAESHLDKQFEQGTINSESLEASLLEIGRIRAQLRYVHLQAHLSQTDLLRPEQIRKYDAVRGYGATSHGHNDHSTMHDRQD